MPEPLTYLAVPLSFSDKVGVPVTFTASLILSVRRTVSPTPTVPLPFVIPGPFVATHCTIGAVVSVADGLPVDGAVPPPVSPELPEPDELCPLTPASKGVIFPMSCHNAVIVASSKSLDCARMVVVPPATSTT